MEIRTLADLLERARHAGGRDRDAAHDAITPGDLVQLQPGATPTWSTSFLLVCQVRGDRIRGQILRPHRGGCREAWADFSLPEVSRVGRAPYPEPAPDVRSWCYAPPCPLTQRKPPASAGRPAATLDHAQSLALDHHRAVRAQLTASAQLVTRRRRARGAAAPGLDTAG